ncbi:MAG: tetratricopeptide repeat protein [Chloroflexota bacterium]|nr:tetratricopeptide repeat protein [Chloroflexota bacterium]
MRATGGCPTSGDLLLDDLRRLVASRQVVAVVGAGVAVGAAGDAKVASWTGLLEDGIARCIVVLRATADWGMRMREGLRSGDLDEVLSVAEQVSSRLGAPAGGEYRRWLRETVGSLRIVRPEVLEALKDLGVPLATTNYDGLIEEATGWRPVTWRDSARTERVLRGDEQGVLHLHGHWEDPESVVLGIRSYEAVLGDAHAQAALRVLRLTRSLLFVGFGAGLADPNFGALLRWTRMALASDEYRQFRLTRAGEVEALQRQHPPEERIFVVPYGDRHDDLAPFLRGLGGPPDVRARPAPRPAIRGERHPVAPDGKQPNPIANQTMRSSSLTEGALPIQTSGQEVQAQLRNEGGGMEEAAPPRVAQPAPPPLSERPDRDWPAPSTPLIGRDRDVAAVHRLLAQARLVTLTGTGGVGKTHLAVEAAAGLTANFPDGVFWVDLSSVSDPSLVALTVSRELGVPEVEGRTVPEGLVQYLRSRSALLVLDNFEQVLPAAELIAHLLAACRGLRVLTTSRAPLNLSGSGEQRYDVDPLPTPSEGPHHWTTIAESPAVELFVAEARRVRSAFALTPENAAVVAAICRRLSGLPLAIKLAADWVGALAPTEILRQLGQLLDSLEGGGPDLPERQRTMRAAIAWSYKLLSADEQAMFRSFSVFRGPFSLKAAEKVCSASPRLRKLANRGVVRLVERGLLHRVAGEGRESRYAMLPVIQEYAEELLADRRREREVNDIRRLHAIWYRDLADRASMASGRIEAEIFRQLEAEHDNVRVALQTYLTKEELSILLEMSSDLTPFWHRYGYLREGAGWVSLGLAPNHDPPPRLKLRALSSLAGLLFGLGNYKRAKELYEQSLALARELGDRAGEASSLRNLGSVAASLGDYARAKELHEQSLALARELGNRAGEASSLGNLGLLAYDAGDLSRAEQLLDESRVIDESLGLKHSRAIALSNIAMLHCHSGNTARAAQLYREAIELFEVIGDRDGVAWCLEGAAAVAWREAQAGRAARLAGAAEVLRESTGTVVPPDQKRRIDNLLRPLRDRKDESVVRDSWAAGRAHTADQAIADALA